jgi:hypothetical protein
MKPAISSVLSLIITAFLLIEGIWGLFSPVVYWVLTTNRAHAIIHIFLGVIGLVARQKGYIRSFFGFLGSLLVVVAVIWLVPATREIPTDLLNVSGPVAALNLVLGAVALLLAFTVPARRKIALSSTGRTRAPFQT